MDESAVVTAGGAGGRPAPGAVVRIRGILKSYKGQAAVRGVDLDVAPGEIYGLIGPDGAGKSSVMKAVAGVLAHDAGTLEVLGKVVDSEGSAERIKVDIGFMPQGLGQNLYPELSVEENIDFFARSRLVPREQIRERKDRLLAMTRLAAFRDRPMKNLSGGMKQKLGLVCTLIHEPRLVILDEPTTGVDPVSRRDFWSILTQLLRERGITALISTAYMDEASRFHRLSLFFGGKVIASGTPDELTALAPGAVVTLRCGAQAMAMERLREHFPQVEARGELLRVFVRNATDEEAAQRALEVLNGMDATVLYTGVAELEDVFIARLSDLGLAAEEGAGGEAEGAAKPGAAPILNAREANEDVAIEAKGLVRTFGEFRAVDDVSFRVPQGEIFGLLGANGAGKTTVIKMLVGLLPPTGGRGMVAGRDMRRAPREIKEHIGYMSQVFSLYGDLTVTENIRLYAGIYGLGKNESRERVQWVLHMADLEGMERKPASSLPVGVRQRLALGCALVHRPRILFLDEPTSGVDPVGRRRFWDILFQLSKRDKVAILITTHYMSEAEHCDHLALMYAGRIVADSTPERMKRELEEEAGRLLEIHTDNPLSALSLLEGAGFEGAALHGNNVHVLARDLEEAERRARQSLSSGGVRVLSVSGQPLGMEDVFVYRVLALEKEEKR